MNKKKKIILVVNIITIFVLVFFIWKQDPNYIASSNTVSYLEENEDFVMPVIQEEDQVEIKNHIKETPNSNMDVVQTKTLIDYDVTSDPVKYAQENKEEMVNGLILNVDDTQIYVKDEKIIDQTKDKIINILITDPEVKENYELTGELNNYVKDGKTITSINFENEISIEESEIPKSKMIDTSEELMFKLFHKDEDFDQIKYYTVEENQTFDQVKKISKLNDTEFFINNSSFKGTPLLKAGDKIIINKIDPLLNVAIYYEYSKEEILKYDTIKKETDDLDKGDTKVKRKGKNGKSLVTYRVKYLNGEVVSEVKVDFEELQKVVNKIVLVGTHEEYQAGISSSTNSGDTTPSSSSNVGGFIWPMDSRNVTCGFGCYSGHTGIDIQGGYGANVYASKSGTVATSGYSAYGGGYEVTINHGGGVYTIYSHMKQQPNVSVGQSVSQGQVIGYMGATGNVTGPHLHFEIRLGCSSGAFSGTPVNALGYLP